MFRKRYNSPLAIILVFMAILFATEGLFWVTAFMLAIAWIWGTEAVENPEFTVSLGEILREVLRMLPIQAIVVALFWVLSFVFFQHTWVMLVLVIIWFFGSIILPMWISGNTYWYLENHLLVTVGYFLLCLACWVWLGPWVLTLLLGI